MSRDEIQTPEWQPLSITDPGLIIKDRLGDQGILMLPTMGTCGDPRQPDYIPWREETFNPIAEQEYSIGDKVWSPVVVEGWNPSMAAFESLMGARAEVIALNVENTPSPASDLEAGLLTYGTILRGGQEIGVRVAPSDGVPRKIARAALGMTAQAYPLFHAFDTVEKLARHTSYALQKRIERRERGIIANHEFHLPPPRHDLRPAIYLAGTSGATRPAWLDEVTDTIRDFDRARGKKDTPIKDSYDPNWSVESELEYKFNDAVQLIAITDQTDSFGALAELGWRILHAHLAGQSMGVYIDAMRGDDPKAPTNRVRRLFLAHMDRLRQDFPDLPVYIAPTLFDLALFGANELNRQEVRLGSLKAGRAILDAHRGNKKDQ